MYRPCMVLLGAWALGCAPIRPAPPAEAPPLLQLPSDVRPLRYALDVEVVPSRDRFRGTVAIDVELAAARRVIWLHARDLHVTSAEIEVAGRRSKAVLEQVTSEGVARLMLPAAVGPGRATLRFRWDGTWGDSTLSGLYRFRSGPDSYAVTQFEAIEARRAFPCFDEPSFKAPFEVAMTVSSEHTAVSNGPAISEDPLPGGLKRVRFAATPPLPTYLVFLGAGPFEVITSEVAPNELRPRPLPLRALVPRGRAREAGFGLRSAGESVEALERWFASPLPYEKLDLVVTTAMGAGAMENAGAILFADFAFLFDEGRTAERWRPRIAETIAHEIAHHWFGDSVTLPWWTDLWLNESFAQYLGGEIAQAQDPRWGVELKAAAHAERAMQTDALASARAIRQPLGRTEEIGQLFDGLTYDKGAAVLRTFRRWLGAERFREGLRSYVDGHAHGVGSADELLASLSRAAGVDVATPFRGFIEQQGVPLIAARATCDAGGARLVLSQSRYRPRGSSAPDASWQVPVCVRFAADGASGERCALVGPAGATLDLGRRCPEWVFPDAGGVGYYRWTLPPADLARLRSAGLRRLEPAERLSLARNVRAARRAGAVPFREAMETLAALARDPEDEVAGAGMEAIAEARDFLLGPADREAAEEAGRALYGPLLAGGTGFDPPAGEGEAHRRLRVRAVEFLVTVARDPRVRAEAARRGAAYAAPAEGDFRSGAVEPDLAAVALEAAVEEDPSLYPVLLARLRALSDGDRRRRILRALSLVAPFDGPEALWRDRALLPTERMLLLAWNDRPAVRRRAFEELRRGLSEVEPLVPQWGFDDLPAAAADLCDAEGLEAARALFEPAVARYPGMRLATANVLEDIRLCIADRQADGSAAAAWFRERAGAQPER